ncbi:double-strand break repair protein AddB [Henriciella litoralis]|uniref:double-strand break repair protein AddB n=1 Tax=Henriciella litoralis TaxID=568102 RepID=UPI000A023E27|nr:double-strand break repair protein AddB [Henriciella litoralis]
MSAPGLFAPGAPKLRTIPPGADFLKELARALAEEKDLANNADALADDLIYVPNRRSARALALALFKAAGGTTILMPDIRPLGDLESDEPPPGTESALADLPPAISPAERLGQLSRLVSEYYDRQGKPIPPASSLAAARELARLLDQAALSGEVDWDQLDAVVEDQQLSQHWEKSVQFLKIIIEAWPDALRLQDREDPYTRRLLAAKAVADSWAATPPKGDVIIAGSTGADPTGRTLMKAALHLPRALIVLPGLDRSVDKDAWADIATSPSHPQFSLAQTLADLDYQPDEVADWPGLKSDEKAEARRALIHEALAPADGTAHWLKRLNELAGGRRPEDFAEDGLSGLTLIEADDDGEEAWCAALLMRRTLETPGRTAALVTPDAGLARRVAALMRQWNVDLTPSGGRPLLQTPAGSLSSLVMDWSRDPTHPVLMLAALKHGQVTYDYDLFDFERFFLRGPRRWEDWPGFHAHIDRIEADKDGRKRSGITDDHIAASRQIADDLQARFEGAGLIDPDTELHGQDYLVGISELLGSLGSAPLPWAGEDGAALSRALRDFADVSTSLLPATPEVWTELFKAWCATITVRGAGGEHPRLSIWGPLEARLQSADCLILAGLNEGVWPAQPSPDAFLPRNFRRKLGFSDPDERIGLSAHDFAQLAAAPDVTLLTSKRRGDSPAVASRWVWRLTTLARGALKEKGAIALAPSEENDPRRWLAALKTPDKLESFSAEPRPTPDWEARPKALSVTRIETLQRDPYAIYAQRVLGLYPLEQLDMPVDVRPRGTAIHAALEKFELPGIEKSADQLVAMLEQELRDAGEAEEAILGAVAVRRKVVEEYLAWREQRLHLLSGAPYTEISGSYPMPIEGRPGETFMLSANADRVERHQDGSLAILDFKSGLPPGEGEVRTGLNPQMPLSAIIALEDGFKTEKGHTLKTDKVSALTYVRFGSKFDVRNIGDASGRDYEAMALEDIIEDTRVGVSKLIARFADPTHPYLSMPRPKRAKYGSDYERLARRDEWIGESGDE